MDDLYDDQGAAPNTPTMEAEPEHAAEDADEPTAIIPKSLLAGKEFAVGDSVVLKIKAMHEDGVEVEYDTSGTKDEHSTSMADGHSENPDYD